MESLSPAVAGAGVAVVFGARKRSSRQQPVGRTNPGAYRAFVLDSPHALVENASGVSLGRGRQEPRAGPKFGLVVFAHRCHILRRDPEEPGRKVARRVRVFAVHDGRGSGDACRVFRAGVAESAKATEQASGLGPHGARERVGLVEHQVVQACTGEELDVATAGQQQLQLLHIGEENTGLAARRPHRFARAHFLRRADGLSLAVLSRLIEPRLVVRPRRANRQPMRDHVRLLLRRLADVDAEGNPSASQQLAKPLQLVFRQRVHGVDDHGADARRPLFVPQLQALADDWIEKALGLTRAGSGGHQRGPSLGDSANGLLLMAVQVRDLFGNPLPQQRVQQPFGHQVFHRRALPERAGQAYVRPLQQGRLPGLVQGQEFAHLAA